MADYDGLPLNTPTLIRSTVDFEVWATRTANGGTVETRLIGTAATVDANLTTLLTTKATAVLSTNGTYNAQPALPAGTALTTTQLTTAIRLLRAQVDALTRQNNALIRLAINQLNTISDT